MPYHITCGNGVTYTGDTLFQEQDDFGQKGEVSYDGGCGSFRTPTYTWHQYQDNPPVRVDTTDWSMRGAWFSFNDYGYREIGSINGWKHFPVQAVLDSWKGLTVTLPPYPGGSSKLSTPVLFVHGLDVPYTETWGVQAPACSASTVSMVGGVSSWDTMEVATTAVPGIWNLTALARPRFSGMCSDGSSSEFQNLIQLFSTAWALGYNDTTPSLWSSFVQQHPPILTIDSYDGMTVNGSLRIWITAGDETRLLSTPFTSATPTGAASQWIDGVEMKEYIYTFARIVSSSEVKADLLESPASFGAGLVRTTPDAYGSGTGPDVISRMQRLQKGDSINQNGIYFFNGYRWVPDSASWIQPLPWWSDGGPVFPGQPGESWSLYNRIADVLTRQYGTSWMTDTSKKLDLVCHSQGGISTREMLANAGGSDPFGNPMPTGAANPANHIRKVVTVNSPHFGSVEVSPLSDIPPEFSSSIGRLLQDSARTDIELANISVDPTLLGRLEQDASAQLSAVAGLGYWFYQNDWDSPSGTLQGIGVALMTPLYLDVVPSIAGLVGLTSRLDVEITGNWLKTHQLKFKVDPPIGDPVTVTSVNHQIDYAYNRLFHDRAVGAHLGINSDNIRRLSLQYPKLPDGQDLHLQPLYSTVSGMGDVIHAELAQQTRGLCDMDAQTQSAECYGLADILGQPIDSWVQDVGLNMPIMQFLDTYRDGWLANSDIAVQTQSQQALITGSTWDPASHPGSFSAPRSYALRRAMTLGRFPDTIAPHGTVPVNFSDTLYPYAITSAPGRGLLGYELAQDTSQTGWVFASRFSLRGAPWLGHDIYCALDLGCEDLLAGTGIALRMSDTTDTVELPSVGKMAYRSVPVTGDFQFTGVSQDTGTTGFLAIGPGDAQPRLAAVLTRADGLQITTAQGTTTLVPPGWTVRPQIARVGDSLKILAKSWNGQILQTGIQLPPGIPSLTVGLIQPGIGSDTAAILVGQASLPDSVLHPTPAGAVQVWHMEARGSQTNVSKPRIALVNSGRIPITGVRIVYVFRADPARQPVLDAPAGFPGHIEQIQGDLWRLVIQDPQATVQPGGIWPASDVAQITLRYSDWSDWPLVKDPSEDRNWGGARLNSKIAAYDRNGRLLWGRDLSDGGQGLFIQAPSVEVFTQEQAVGASNSSKPSIRIYDRGNTSFFDFKATWYFRLPLDKTPVLQAWYNPETDLSLRPLGQGIWAVDALFDKHRLYPGQVVDAGQWGLNLTDWSPWDHSKDPSHEGIDGIWQANPWVVLTDSTGKVIWGNKPSLDGGTAQTDTGAKQDSIPLSVRIEAKNESPGETNIVKPRFRLTNTGTGILDHFTVHFPIHAERGLVPTAELYWTPGCSISSQDNGGGNWDFRLTCTGEAVPPSGVWPTPDGAVLGFYYPDWSAWDSSNDPAFAQLGANFAPDPGITVTP